MDIEASTTLIAKRLQKLRQWQAEQKEKLLRQQQIQRETLSNKQVRICQAFGLPTHDFVDTIENMEDTCVVYEVETKKNSEETIINASVSQYDTKLSDGALDITGEEMPMNVSHESYERERIEEQGCTSLNINENINCMGDHTSDTLLQSRELNTDLLIEGIKLLPLDNTMTNGCIMIDDIPVSSSKKDFQTLLEERLKKESEVTPITQIQNLKTNIKKPFLRKGQGLSRFKMSVNSQPLVPRLITKRHNASLNTRRIESSDKKKVHKTTHSGSSSDASLSNGTQQLSLKSVPLPRKKMYKMSKSIAPVKRAMHQANTSDFDLRAERELEEVRIFELLEEKAENSSFCSTSSAVLAFLQQSTPFKIKERLPNYENKDDVTSTKQRTDKVERESVEQHAHNIMSKPNVQHYRTCSDGVDSYMNTVVVDDMPKEIWSSVNQISQGTEATRLENQNTSCSRRVFAVSLSDNNDEEKISMRRDNRTVAHDSNMDVNHRVRFAKHNEYRTIDLINVSNTSNESTMENYLEQDWNDRSNNTSESSDEEKLPLTYGKHESSLKIIANEKAIDASIRLSLQHDNATRDSYYRVSTMKASSSSEEALNCKEKLLGEEAHGDNEICASIVEEIVETSDEEQSILSSSSSSSLPLSSSTRQGLCTHEKKEYALENKSEKIMDRVEIRSNAEAVKHCSYEDETNQTSTFRPELLKCRLLELEKEIDIFRKESSALLQQRRKLQEDQTTLHKEYAEREKKFEEIKRRVQNQLEEEKKRLARERGAMENRIRDTQEKTRQNKVERHKAQDLQEQLEKLKDELNIKESRWNAAESRYKSELRTLRVEIAKLKQEITNLQNVKRTNTRNVMKSGGQAITKAINQINKRISTTSQFKEISAKTSNSSDISDHDNDDDDDDDNDNEDKDKEKKKTNISLKKEESEFEIGLQSKRDEKFEKQNIAKKKRNLYENLLKDVTSDLIEHQDSFYITRNIDKSCQSSPTDLVIEQIQNLNVKSNDDFANEDPEYATNYMKHRTDGRLCRTNHSRDTNDEIQAQKNGEPSCEKVNSNSILRHSSFYHRTSSETRRSIKDVVKQIQHPDGCIEYWYPNGNVKKIFPDQGITKMIYYNGDVRETDRDGKVKYFYATTQTSHITTPDGLEILEFSNGQVEKHTSDGTIQVSFPDGATRIAQTDGTEKWILPDGTVAQTFTNGDKILILPNGQREIHTKEHKRREYPDGTIKLVYPDGKQETRYSNGRKRLKDKDGNLLMDS